MVMSSLQVARRDRDLAWSRRLSSNLGTQRKDVPLPLMHFAALFALTLDLRSEFLTYTPAGLACPCERFVSGPERAPARAHEHASSSIGTAAANVADDRWSGDNSSVPVRHHFAP
jgi:hypothetical protein